jgi:DNA-binding transcriptional MerR regulator
MAATESTPPVSLLRSRRAALSDVCVAAATDHPRPDGEDRYTVSEVAEFTGLTTATLRWYEQIGLLPGVTRAHDRQLVFANSDLDWLAFVDTLRVTGMPVADMVRYADLVREGEGTYRDRRLILEEARRDVLARITALQNAVGRLGHEIDACARAEGVPDRR